MMRIFSAPALAECKSEKKKQKQNHNDEQSVKSSCCEQNKERKQKMHDMITEICMIEIMQNLCYV